MLWFSGYFWELNIDFNIERINRINQNPEVRYWMLEDFDKSSDFQLLVLLSVDWLLELQVAV